MANINILVNGYLWIEAMQQETGLRTSPRLSVDDRIDALMRNYCIQIGHPATEDEVMALAALVLMRYSHEDPGPYQQLNEMFGSKQQQRHTYNLRSSSSRSNNN
jgi:hypothetical protein